MKLFAEIGWIILEIEAEIMDKTPAADHRSALSALKQSWRESEATETCGIR